MTFFIALLLLMGATSSAAAPTVRNLSMSSSRACFGAGCYWGTEKFFIKDFNKLYPNSILDGAVGFMGPTTAKANPTYREVCSGQTGHVEVYDCEFTGGDATYEKLVRHFYMFHDPTTLNRQGNDVGTQYASVIFCYDANQEAIAKRVTAELQALVNAGKVKYSGRTVSTDIRTATKFYKAQQDHQAYLQNNPFGYCNHAYRFKAWPAVV